MPVEGECTDIDECNQYRGRCAGDLRCRNNIGEGVHKCFFAAEIQLGRPLKGSFTCNCPYGYNLTADKCVDIDECENQNICPENSVCQNLRGTYACECKAGFDGEFCNTDINECEFS